MTRYTILGVLGVLLWWAAVASAQTIQVCNQYSTNMDYSCTDIEDCPDADANDDGTGDCITVPGVELAICDAYSAADKWGAACEIGAAGDTYCGDFSDTDGKTGRCGVPLQVHPVQEDIVLPGWAHPARRPGPEIWPQKYRENFIRLTDRTIPDIQFADLPTAPQGNPRFLVTNSRDCETEEEGLSVFCRWDDVESKYVIAGIPPVSTPTQQQTYNASPSPPGITVGADGFTFFEVNSLAKAFYICADQTRDLCLSFHWNLSSGPQILTTVPVDWGWKLGDGNTFCVLDEFDNDIWCTDEATGVTTFLGGVVIDDSFDAGAGASSSPATRSTSLPGTCTEGQMHQDTDSGGTETYICTATNTWTKLATGGEKCAVIENLTGDDDGMLFGSFARASTITSVWCNFNGSAPTTAATFTLEDGNGNAMTITGTNPTCAGPGTVATAAAVTAGNALTAREVLRFNVTNTPNPATDTYMLCVSYTED